MYTVIDIYTPGSASRLKSGGATTYYTKTTESSFDVRTVKGRRSLNEIDYNTNSNLSKHKKELYELDSTEQSRISESDIAESPKSKSPSRRRKKSKQTGAESPKSPGSRRTRNRRT